MSENRAQLYGGWRRSKSMGIGLLTLGQSFVVVGAALVPVIAANAGGLSTLVVTLPVTLVVIALTVWQRHGMPLMSLVWGWAKWQWAATRGETSYRGLYLPHPQALDLPGLLAPTKLLRLEETGSGNSVGVVWNQRTGQMAATLLLSPGGALLASRGQVGSWVGAWGNVLSSLATEDTVDAATVTIQITPSSGSALATHVADRIDTSSPQGSQDLVRELVERAPRTSSQLAAWLTLVTSPMRAADRPEGPAEAAAETLRRLDGVDLSAGGASVLRRATDVDLVRLVRGAFSPQDADAAESEMGTLTWDQAGPASSEEDPTVYEHDGAYSVSWVLREAPRRPVPYNVLLSLLSPGRFRRRVTIGYRVLPPEEAASVVERELTAGDAREEYRRRTKRSATRRERADAAAAARTADEEAYGAGLVQWTIYVTTTVTDAADLPAARRETEMLAKQAGGLRFRYAFHGQAAAFVAGLPVGVHPLA